MKTMKKILFIILFSFICIIGNAQIYNTIKYVDKFDDVIKEENIKTLISNYYLNDYWLIFKIETKNKSIKEYACYMPNIMIKQYGDDENVINLIDDVYGYQTDYICCDIKDTLTYKRNVLISYHVIDSLYKDADDEEKCSYLRQLIKKDNENVFILTDRTITTQYTKSFINRYFWIKRNDGSRIIYKNK